MKKNNKEKICDAMILLLKDKPLSDIRINELTELAGVNRSSYNYYFYSLEEVIDCIIDNLCVEIISYETEIAMYTEKNGRGSVNSDTDGLPYALFEAVLEHRDVIDALHDAGYGARLDMTFVARLEGFLSRLNVTMVDEDGREFSFSENNLKGIYIKQLAYEILSYFEYWRENAFNISIRDMILLTDRASRIFVKSVKYRNGREKNKSLQENSVLRYKRN